jgi:Predicted ester cyclase
MTDKDAIRMLFSEILNKGRYELPDDLVGVMYVEHNPVPGHLPGAEGIRNKLKAFTLSFPDLQFGLEDCIAEGDLVAARYHREGTQKGDFFGIPATGRRVSVAGMDSYRFGDGKLVGHRDCADMQGLFRQPG